jgi:RNA polymerase sigma factor (sigma-70 family)
VALRYRHKPGEGSFSLPIPTSANLLEAESAGTGHNLEEILAEEKPSSSEVLEANERAEIVRCAIAALPEDLRLPLVLAEYEDLSQAEISEVLGCSVKAVETRIYRARQQLRTSLARLL